LGGKKTISIIADPDEEETLEDLLDQISEGEGPSWLWRMLLEGLKREELEVISIERISTEEPPPEEELDFDE
jgi:hypothetical protein